MYILHIIIVNMKSPSHYFHVLRCYTYLHVFVILLCFNQYMFHCRIAVFLRPEKSNVCLSQRKQYFPLSLQISETLISFNKICAINLPQMCHTKHHQLLRYEKVISTIANMTISKGNILFAATCVWASVQQTTFIKD